MDHLKWIWNLQEMASDGNLPELPGTRVFRKEAESSAKRGAVTAEAAEAQAQTAAAKSPVEELSQLLALTAEAEWKSRLLQKESMTEMGESTVVFSPGADRFGSAAAYAVGTQVGAGGITMDEISRFFEIDARRF